MHCAVPLGLRCRPMQVILSWFRVDNVEVSACGDTLAVIHDDWSSWAS